MILSFAIFLTFFSAPVSTTAFTTAGVHPNSHPTGEANYTSAFGGNRPLLNLTAQHGTPIGLVSRLSRSGGELPPAKKIFSPLQRGPSHGIRVGGAPAVASVSSRGSDSPGSSPAYSPGVPARGASPGRGATLHSVAPRPGEAHSKSSPGSLQRHSRSSSAWPRGRGLNTGGPLPPSLPLANLSGSPTGPSEPAPTTENYSVKQRGEEENKPPLGMISWGPIFDSMEVNRPEEKLFSSSRRAQDEEREDVRAPIDKVILAVMEANRDPAQQREAEQSEEPSDALEVEEDALEVEEYHRAMRGLTASGAQKTGNITQKLSAEFVSQEGSSSGAEEVRAPTAPRTASARPPRLPSSRRVSSSSPAISAIHDGFAKVHPVLSPRGERTLTRSSTPLRGAARDHDCTTRAQDELRELAVAEEVRTKRLFSSTHEEDSVAPPDSSHDHNLGGGRPPAPHTVTRFTSGVLRSPAHTVTRFTSGVVLPGDENVLSAVVRTVEDVSSGVAVEDFSEGAAHCSALLAVITAEERGSLVAQERGSLSPGGQAQRNNCLDGGLLVPAPSSEGNVENPAAVKSSSADEKIMEREDPSSAVQSSSTHKNHHVFSFGDFHGDYERFRGVLQAAGVASLPEGGVYTAADRQAVEWLGGGGSSSTTPSKNITVVFVGDIIDKGPQPFSIYVAIFLLQEQAELSGGRVELLLGNHEMMRMNDDFSQAGSVEEFHHEQTVDRKAWIHYW